jgi:transcription elongation factor GreA
VVEGEKLTLKQADALREELEALEGPRRAEVVAAIKKAREFGDLSENFEYHAAKNEQGLLEARIRTLRHRLDTSEIVAVSGGDTVSIGSRVEIEDPTGKTLTVEISNLTKPGAVSPTAPLGAALMGARPGDEVEVAAPRGAWTAKVLSISAA